MEYARENMSRTWDHVLFSDEKKFNLDGPDNFNFCWRDLRKYSKCFSNSDGGSLMVWTAFWSSGKVELAFPTSRMDNLEYIEILENDLMPFIHSRNHFRWTYQQHQLC